MSEHNLNMDQTNNSENLLANFIVDNLQPLDIKIHEIEEIAGKNTSSYVVKHQSNLASFIKERFPEKCVPEHQTQRLMQQILAFFKDSRYKEIRDLQLEDIIVLEDEDFRLKVVKHQDLSDSNDILIHKAPDILEEKFQNANCLIWSLGVMIFQLLSSNYSSIAPLLNGENSSHITLEQLDSSIESLPSSPIVKELLKQMLKTNSSERIKFDELLAHPWVTGAGLNPKIHNGITGDYIKLEDSEQWFPATSQEFERRYYKNILTRSKQPNVYIMEKKMSEESVSTLYKGRNQPINTDIAIVIAPKDHGKEQDDLMVSELEQTSRAHHKDIGKLLDYCKSHANHYLIFEFCQDGISHNQVDLHDRDIMSSIINPPLDENLFVVQSIDNSNFAQRNGFVANNNLALSLQNRFPKKYVPEHQAQKIVQQIVADLRAILDEGIPCQDVNLEDILIDDKCNLRIDCSKWWRPLVLNSEEKKEEEKEKSDTTSVVWSIGCLILQILSHNYNFVEDDNGISFSDQLMEIMITNGSLVSSIESLSVMPIVKELLKRMLETDPSERIDLYKLFEHPWMTGGSLNIKIRNKFMLEDVEDIELMDAGRWFPDTTPEFKIRYYKLLLLKEPTIYTMDRVLPKNRKSSSFVYRGESQSTSSKVVVKILPRGNKKEEARDDIVLSQFNFLLDIRHNKNIVKIVDYCKSQRYHYLIFEYCENGHLDKFVKDYFQNDSVPEYEAYFLIQKILSGTMAIMQKGIVCHDLRLEKVLLDRDYTPKIDYSVSTILEEGNSAETTKKEISNNYQRIIWSLGVIAYQIITGDQIHPSLLLLQKDFYEAINSHLDSILSERRFTSIICKMLTSTKSEITILQDIDFEFQNIKSCFEISADTVKMFNNLEELAAAVSWTNLKYLNLKNRSIRELEIEKLANINSWINLEGLSLEDNNMGALEAEKLACNTSWINLRYIHLDNNNIAKVGAEMLACNTSWTNLEELSLKNNRIGDIGAEKLACNSSWTNIKRISLETNNIGALGAEKLACNTSWTNLRHLHLDANDIGDLGTEKLTCNTSWTKLEKLSLNTNDINAWGAEKLACSTFCMNLRYLSLKNNQIGAFGAEELARSTFLTNLEELNLEDNKIGDTGAEMIASNTSWTKLRHLFLSWNQINALGAEKLACNTSWTNLQMLFLDVNNIGNLGAEKLASNVSWTKLEKLSLDINSIGNLGVEKMASNTSWVNLRNLDLQNNKIGALGADRLASNTSWTNLKI